MDFEELTRKRLLYYPNAEIVLAWEIQEARNAYAAQKILGRSQTAWEIKQKLSEDLRQAKTELKGELQALDKRRRSVIAALRMAEQKIEWPLWPDLGHRSHEDVMADVMKSHRRLRRESIQLRKCPSLGGSIKESS